MIKSYSEIQGWFDYEDLYKNFSEVLSNDSTFVEVGVWKGRSVCFLGQLLKINNKKPKVFAVDTFKGSDDEGFHQEEVRSLGGSTLPLFKSYLEDLQLTDLILPVEKDSSVAAESFEDNSIDIIFIDANHSYEGVKKDLQSWFSKVKIKGIIAGHDFWAEQVKSAVLDFMATKSVKVFETSSSCWIAQK